MFRTSTESAALEATAHTSPDGLVSSSHAEDGSWSLAVREHQTLPHWAYAIVQGASIAALVSLVDAIRGRFEWGKVLGWGIGWSIAGFVSSRWRARRYRAVLRGDDRDLTIDGRSVALAGLLDCELRPERRRSACFEVILKCRNDAEIVALSRLTRRQGELCLEVLKGRLGSRLRDRG